MSARRKVATVRAPRGQVGDGEGHTYMLENVPFKIWNRFDSYTKAHGQKLRFNMIVAIEEFLARREASPEAGGK